MHAIISSRFLFNVFMQGIAIDCPNELSDSPVLQLSCDAAPDRLSESIGTSPAGITFREIIDVSDVQTPRDPAKQNGRRRKVAHAAIVTSSPFKRALEDSLNAQGTKKQSKKRTGKTKKQPKTANRPMTDQQLPSEHVGPQQSCNDVVTESTTTQSSFDAAESERTSERKTKKKNQQSKTAKESKTENRRRNGKNARTRKTTKDRAACKVLGENGQTDDTDDTRCLYCGEFYRESIDAWVCCNGGCNQWAHELCAGNENDSTDFVCELCSN
jgi:hypothetical protein